MANIYFYNIYNCNSKRLEMEYDGQCKYTFIINIYINIVIFIVNIKLGEKLFDFHSLILFFVVSLFLFANENI